MGIIIKTWRTRAWDDPEDQDPLSGRSERRFRGSTGFSVDPQVGRRVEGGTGDSMELCAKM